jgi:acetyl-CoA acetyltransferase
MTVAIVGIGELRQGRSAAASPMALHEALIRRALDDAGLALSDVDAILTLSPRADPYLIHSAALAESLRVQPAIAWTLEAGGAAPIAMLEVGRGLIEGGRARTVLGVGADMPLGTGSRHNYIKTLADVGPVHPDYERPFAPTVPSLFAMVARAHMDAFGTTRAHLAAVALQDRKMAALHPNAHHVDPLSIEMYLAGAPIADPLTLFDCAPVSDGGGAYVLTSVERARDLARPPVTVVASGFSTGHLHLSAAASLVGFSAGRALDQAFRNADLSRDAIDVAMIYDCFTIAMLVNLEDLGFVSKGQAGAAFAAGEFGAGGRLPVNTHGGLLSHGHPARAGGMGNVIEAVMQLRGDAGARQVSDAEIALVHGMGGVFAAHGVALLGKA